MQALECLNVSLKIKQNILGNINPSTATSYNNIGGLYDSMGDYEKAVEYIKKGLQIRKTIFGENHTDVAASYNNLGGEYLELSDYPRAIENLTKALEIRIRLFGEKHPSVAKVYSNLGKAYEQEGQLKDAERCYSCAHKVYLERYPADDERVVREQKKIDNVRTKIK